MIDRRLYIKSLKAVFSNNRQISTIIQRTKQLSLAKEILDSALPASLATQTSAFAYQNYRLTLTVASSTWLAKLRFYIPELLSTFQSHEEFATLKKILLKVAPTSQPSTYKQRKEVKPISKRNAQMLEESAASMEEGALKKALLKLARNSANNSNEAESH